MRKMEQCSQNQQKNMLTERGPFRLIPEGPDGENLVEFIFLLTINVLCAKLVNSWFI